MTTLGIIIGCTNTFCALLCAGLGLPMLRRQVAPNPWYGVRFKRCYESDELWYAINEYGARTMLWWSLPVLVCGLLSFFTENESWIVLYAFVPMVYIVSAVQTWLYARSL